MFLPDDTENEENKKLEQMLESLFPYQVQSFYFLKNQEKNKKGGFYDPILFGGKRVLISMMLENFLEYTRDNNMNLPKRMRPLPKNTIVFSKNIDNWRTEFENYGGHLRVSYHEGTAGSNINFHTTDVVVTSCQNLKQLQDSRSKSIQQKDWYRLVVDHDMIENESTNDFILNLSSEKRWIISEPEMLVRLCSKPTKAKFMYALFTGSTSATAQDISPADIDVMIQRVTPSIKSLYPFGSNMVKTISVKLTDEEKEIYLPAEYRVKEKLLDFNKSGAEENLQLFRNLEVYILRLRQMVSSVPLRVNKGNIQGKSKQIEKLNKVVEEGACICGSDLKYTSILFVTECCHLYCYMCVEDYCLTEKKCAQCRAPLDDDTVYCAPFKCVVSSKATELLTRLNSKSVVVSKFDKLLTWLESFLRDKGFKPHRVHSKMEAEEILAITQLFQNTSAEENGILLADLEAISGDIDISSIHEVFFMEAVKEDEENRLINHITGLQGKMNDTFRGAFRLVVTNAIEGKIVGLKGKVGPGFKELNMKEIEYILS